MTSGYSVARLDGDQLAKLEDLERELGVWTVVVRPSAPPAPLSGKALERLQAVEKDIDAVILAYAPGGPRYTLSGLATSRQPAQLNQEQLDRIHQLEQELGVVLVATEGHD